MRKIFSFILLAGVTLAGLIGSPVLGDVNVSYAYVYGFSNENTTKFPLAIKPGVLLCFTMSDSSAVYVDQTSAYAAKRDKNVFYFVANTVKWDKDWAAATGGKNQISTQREVFVYDVGQHRMYRFVDGRYYPLPVQMGENLSTSEKNSLALGMQIWEAVKNQKW